MNLLMKLIVLLLGITAVSAHGEVGLPITLEMVVVFLFYVLLVVVTFTLAIVSCCIGHRPKYEPESNPLLPHAITISKEYRSYVLSEVKANETLAWAHEPVCQNAKSRNEFFLAGLALTATSFLFFGSFFANLTVLIFLSFVCFVAWIVLCIFGIYHMVHPQVLLYGATNRRIFKMIISPKFRKGIEVRVESCDYEELMQISMSRSDDGSGALFFSMNKTELSLRPFNFENLPNVAQVKELIESYKNTTQTV